MKKYKKLITSLIFIVGAIVVASLLLNKPNKKNDEVQKIQVEKSDYSPPSYTQPPTNSEGQIDLSSQEVLASIENISKLTDSLPIYEEFETSVGIKTTINIYRIGLDPQYLIHIDIYGINYQNQELDEEKNPEVTAFKESFIRTKELLQEKGVNIKEIYFVFGGKDYIQETAELWIEKLELL